MRTGGWLILLALLAAPSSAAAAKRSCARTGDTVMKNATVRIFSSDSERVYSCHLKSRRRTFLTRFMADYESLEDYESFIRPRVAGRFVAFGDEFGCTRYGDCYEIVRLGAGNPLRLDQGNIDPRSLATNARRIYWTRDGQPFTATWR